MAPLPVVSLHLQDLNNCSIPSHESANSKNLPGYRIVFNFRNLSCCGGSLHEMLVIALCWHCWALQSLTPKGGSSAAGTAHPKVGHLPLGILEFWKLLRPRVLRALRYCQEWLLSQRLLDFGQLLRGELALISAGHSKTRILPKWIQHQRQLLCFDAALKHTPCKLSPLRPPPVT